DPQAGLERPDPTDHRAVGRPALRLRSVTGDALRVVDGPALGGRAATGREPEAVARADVDVPRGEVRLADRLPEPDGGTGRPQRRRRGARTDKERRGHPEEEATRSHSSPPRSR